MDEEYRLIPMPNVVRLTTPNQSFNNYFTVCSTAPAHVGQILTTQRIERMVNFKERLATAIAFSFVAGSCNVAIGWGQDILDPTDYYADNKEQIKIYYNTVLTILAIIDELNLIELI